MFSGYTRLSRIVLLMLVVTAVPFSARAVQEEMLVSTAWLRQHARSVIILHVGDRAGYDAGHIPGAVLLETSAIAVDRDGIPSELPPVEQLGRVFRAAGVDGRSRIVLYSADQQLAARAWFTLDYLGQGKRTSILDGGLAKWRADGGEVTQKASKPAAGTFESSVVPQDVTHLATLRELVRLRDQLGPNLVLIDARSPAQFDGVEAGPDVQHAGHIPSAVNVPSSLNFTADGTYRSPQDLLALYERAGVTADSANVVYCRTGMSAAIPFFVLRYLGYDATLYDGSYVEWSKAGEPAEQ